MIGMVIIVAGMIVSFLKIDKIQLEIKSGDFVIVSYELDNEKKEMKAIENKKEELAEILKTHNIQAEIFTIAIPDFTAYKTYGKNNVSPYSIQIADDSFLIIMVLIILRILFYIVMMVRNLEISI